MAQYDEDPYDEDYPYDYWNRYVVPPEAPSPPTPPVLAGYDDSQPGVGNNPNPNNTPGVGGGGDGEYWTPNGDGTFTGRNGERTLPVDASFGGGGGGGGGYGGGLGRYQAPQYVGAQYMDPGEFDPGPAFAYDKFAAPDPSKVGEDPAFQFRFQQGIKALEADRAGKGTFRTGATGKALQDYGQNSASQEYGNIWNRALSEYDTNRNNAFGTWAAGYGQRKDQYGFRAQNYGAHNQFNQNDSQAQNSFNLQNAAKDWESLFAPWAKSGDWLSGIFADSPD